MNTLSETGHDGTVHRTTRRGIPITEDHGIRFDKLYSRAGTTFRPAWIWEVLEQSDSGWHAYSVTVQGPVQTMAGKDSKASSGKITFGTRYGVVPLNELPRRLREYLIGPEALAKRIDLPKGGAR